MCVCARVCVWGDEDENILVLKSHRMGSGRWSGHVPLRPPCIVTWQLRALANPRPPHQPPRVAQPEEAELSAAAEALEVVAAEVAALEAAVPVLSWAPAPPW